VEPYNICIEYIVNPCISISNIFNSTNIDVQDQIMPTHKFHSLLQKMNKEHFIFYDVMYRKNQNPNEPIHLFITGGASIGKTFTLMFIIQALICYYNIHPHLCLLKWKVLLMAYIRKIIFNIDGTIIHSSLFTPLNCKGLLSLNLEHLDNLVKKYDQLQLIVLDDISFK